MVTIGPTQKTEIRLERVTDQRISIENGVKEKNILKNIKEKHIRIKKPFYLEDTGKYNE